MPFFPAAYERSIISGQTDVVNSPHSDLEEEGSKSELLDLTDASYRGGYFLYQRCTEFKTTGPIDSTLCHTSGVSAYFRTRSKLKVKFVCFLFFFVLSPGEEGAPGRFWSKKKKTHPCSARLGSARTGQDPRGMWLCSAERATGRRESEDTWGGSERGGFEPKLWKWPEPWKLLSNWLWRNRPRCGQQR